MSNYDESRACITYGNCNNNTEDCIACNKGNVCKLKSDQTSASVISDVGGGSFTKPNNNNAIYIQEWYTGGTLGVNLNNYLLYNPYDNQDTNVKNTKYEAFKKTRFWIAKIKALYFSKIFSEIQWYTESSSILAGDWIVLYTKDTITKNSNDGPFFLCISSDGTNLEFSNYSDAVDTKTGSIKDPKFIFQILYAPNYRLNVKLKQGIPFFLWSWKIPENNTNITLDSNFATEVAKNSNYRGLVGVTDENNNFSKIEAKNASGKSKILWGIKPGLGRRGNYTNDNDVGWNVGTNDGSSKFTWPETGQFINKDSDFEYRATNGGIVSENPPPYFALFFTATSTDNCLAVSSNISAFKDYVCLDPQDCKTITKNNNIRFCSGCCCWDPSQFFSGDRYDTMENCNKDCNKNGKNKFLFRNNRSFVCHSGKCVPDDDSYPSSYLRFTSSDCGGACNKNFECVNGQCSVVNNNSDKDVHYGDPTCNGKCKGAKMYTCKNGTCQEITSSLESDFVTFDNNCEEKCNNNLILSKNKHHMPLDIPVSKGNWLGQLEKWISSKVTVGKASVPRWSIVLLIFFIVFVVLYFWQKKRERRKITRIKN